MTGRRAGQLGVSAALPPGLITVEALIERGQDVPRWLVQDMLCPTLNLLAGPAFKGKTWLALHLVKALVEGKPFLGRETFFSADGVAFFGTDPGWRTELGDRCQALGIAGSVLAVDDQAPDWRNASQVRDWSRQVAAAGCGLLVVDNLQGCLRAGESINDDAATRPLLEGLAAACDVGLAVLVVHHMGKPGQFGEPKTFAGSQAIGALPRSKLLLQSNGRRLDVECNASASRSVLDIALDGPTLDLGSEQQKVSRPRTEQRLDPLRQVAERHPERVFSKQADLVKLLIAEPPADRPKWSATSQGEAAVRSYLRNRGLTAARFRGGTTAASLLSLP